MTLEQYIHERFLHGHIINNNENSCNVQLIELDNNGQVVNTYFYKEIAIPYKSQRKIAIIPKPEKINQYRYVIKTKYGLYMFLFIYDIATYDFIYKLYDLQHGLYTWLDLSPRLLLDDIQGKKAYAHNRLLFYMCETDEHPALIEQTMQDFFI